MNVHTFLMTIALFCSIILNLCLDVTGDVMPLNDMTFEDRGRGTHCDTCKANGVVIGQAPGSGLVNGAAAHNGYPAPSASISKGTPAGIPNGGKPQNMVNGYINHGYTGSSTKAAPPRTFRKQGSMISAVTYPSAAGGACSRDGSRCSSVNGAASLDTVALPTDSGQMAPESTPSAAVMMRRRKKKKRERDKKRWASSSLSLLSINQSVQSTHSLFFPSVRPVSPI